MFFVLIVVVGFLRNLFFKLLLAMLLLGGCFCCLDFLLVWPILVIFLVLACVGSVRCFGFVCRASSCCSCLSVLFGGGYVCFPVFLVLAT